MVCISKYPTVTSFSLSLVLNNDESSISCRLAVESYIAKGRDGIAEGISGEGSLLDNAKGQKRIHLRDHLIVLSLSLC
jgi:hypothetical protein